MWIDKIKELSTNKKLSTRQLAIKIGMSEANLYKCFKRKSIELKHLEKIAEVLNVSISVFFDASGKLPYPSFTPDKNNQLAEGEQAQYITKQVEVLQKEISRLNNELNNCQRKLIKVLEERNPKN